MRAFPAVFLIFFFATTLTRAEPGHPSAQLSEVLPGLRAGHPRLLATAANFEQMKKMAGEDPLRAELHARIISRAEAILSQPVAVYKLTNPQRPSMLGGVREAVRKIIDTSLAYRLTGETRFS